jgi:hypothetical protein
MSGQWKFIASLSLWLVAASAFAEPAGVPSFPHDIAPLLKNRCVRCHGPATAKAKLNLAVPTGIVRGGESGHSVVPGKPDESPLWQRVSADEMPADEPLPAVEKQLLRAWIAAGAPGLPANVPEQANGDEHWAFQTLQPTTPPTVPPSFAVRTPVDNFIVNQLEAVGLRPNAEADRATLIRRVAYDLTGLPPKISEIVEYLADTHDDAYERMVERYLASPRYGERWGKYWLDASGYADSNGYFNADTDRPLAYRYRDYVVRSFNADKRWDQFVREQLAGDELAGFKPGGEVTPAMFELLEASHYLRNSPDGTDSSDGNEDELRTDKYSVLEGSMQIVGASLLGLTVQCGKCHDHKFEPFTQQDYYALQSIIYPAFNVEKWVKPKQREVVAATAAQIAAWEAKSKQVEQQITERRGRFTAWLREHRERGRTLFQDSFDGAQGKLSDHWSNTVPGDDAPAGTPAVNLDSPTAPGSQLVDGHLRIVESGAAGDRAIATKQAFDWTPNDTGGWVQASFDLLPESDQAPYVACFLALRDFNDKHAGRGGNVLIDAAAAGKASVHVDYPGGDDVPRGQIGKSGCVPGHNYGVRVTNRGNHQFELAFVVDGQVEEGTVTLSADDLPDGAFGFEYCCGRSFLVDNVIVEVSDAALQSDAEHTKLADQRKQQEDALAVDIKTLESQKGEPLPRLAPVYDLSPEQPDVFVLARGDYKSHKEKAQVAAPRVLSDARHLSLLSLPKSQDCKSTGRRLAFARWLTEPNSRAAALLARVTINRIWQQHFGTGIVATADNLGYSGATPSHPELLEYLSAEFICSGWSTKAIHRQIMNSATYRASSRPPANADAVDPDNRLLGHFPLRRLDAEAIRDAMLAASGELDLTRGGPYVPTVRDDEGAVVVSESTPGSRRRSLYLQQRRTQVTNMLQVFDAPSMVFSCPFRTPTTVPLQSLNLLNSSFVRLRAKALANRVITAAGNETDDRIRYAFLLVANRPPYEAELTAARKFVAQQPKQYANQANAAEQCWTDFCQTLLASNVFIYIE